MDDSLYKAFMSFEFVFIWYFLFINVVYSFLLCLGVIKIAKRKKEIDAEDFVHLLKAESLPEISFILPSYNEAEDILSAIESLVHLSYRYKEIIVVNDGSSDNTVPLLIEKLEMVEIPRYYEDKIPASKIVAIYKSKKHPEVIFLDKEHGKKFDSLNAGLNACRNEYFICVDADTFIEDAAFEPLIRPILTNPKTIAIAAAIRLRNGCILNYNRISTLKFPFTALSALQSIEYLRAFLERLGWESVGGNFVLAGAFAVFQTQRVIDVGGYVDTVAEDMEIVIRLHRVMKEKKIPYNIKYYPDPAAWTDAPQELKPLAKQRANWHRGTCDCLWYHRKLLFNPKYGFFGCFVYPFWLFCEAMEPLIECIGFVYVFVGYYFGMVNVVFVYFFLFITIGFNIIFTYICILIEELSFKKFSSLKTLVYHLVYSFIENVGYRQLTVYWRMRGIWQFISNFKTIRANGEKVSNLIKSLKVKK
jgi:cellulose synthase/poly-beta-1,6-N-acetylglucosamine synthase-like glycosyltransferase